MDPLNKAARLAGAIYLTMVVTGPFSLIYVPTKLIVRGNASATAQNIAAHEMLFRAGMIADLFGAIIFILLGFALYRLLSRVSHSWSLLMLAFVLVSAAVGFVNEVNSIAALTLFRGSEFLDVFDQPQREALALLFLRLHGQGNIMNEIFWGIWLFPFSLLVYRSGFLPRWIGIWLIANGFAWVTLSLIGLLSPDYYSPAFRYAQPFLFGEIAIMLCLLIRGAKMPDGWIDHTLSTSQSPHKLSFRLL